MKLPESKWSVARYVFIFTAIIYTSVGPPAVCVDALMGFFGCVNAWKWRKNCVNTWIEKTCVNVKIHFLIARTRESALFLREYVNFPFLPNFQIFPRSFRKFFPISQKIGFALCVNFQKNLRECVNCEKELSECVNFGFAGGGLKCMHNKLKSMYIIIRL